MFTSKFTAKNVQDVMEWVETMPHHIADGEDSKFFILKGYGTQIRVPVSIYKQTFLKSGEKFDNRMYRWDHEAARKFRHLSIEEQNARFIVKRGLEAGNVFWTIFNPYHGDTKTTVLYLKDGTLAYELVALCQTENDAKKIWAQHNPLANAVLTKLTPETEENL